MVLSIDEAWYAFDHEWGENLEAVLRRLHLLLSDPDFMPLEMPDEEDDLLSYDE